MPIAVFQPLSSQTTVRKKFPVVNCYSDTIFFHRDISFNGHTAFSFLSGFHKMTELTLGNMSKADSKKKEEESSICFCLDTITSVATPDLKIEVPFVAKNNVSSKIASLQDLEDYDCFEYDEEIVPEQNKHKAYTRIFKRMFKRGWFKGLKKFSKSSKSSKHTNQESASDTTNSIVDSSETNSEPELRSTDVEKLSSQRIEKNKTASDDIITSSDIHFYGLDSEEKIESVRQNKEENFLLDPIWI